MTLIIRTTKGLMFKNDDWLWVLQTNIVSNITYASN